MRYRYFFEKDGNSHYLNLSPYYLSTDYNYYNQTELFYNEDHSCMNGVVHGFKNEEEFKNILGKKD